MTNAPVTNLWIDDGSGNLVPVTTSSAVSYSQLSQLPDDVMKFYEDAGVDGIAREAGVIEDEEVVHTTITTVPAAAPANRTIKLIAVPVQSSSKLQTVKVENGAPRPICISTNQNIGTAPIVLTGASGNILHSSSGSVVAPKVIQIVAAPQSSVVGSGNYAHGTSHWSSNILQRKRPNDLFDSMSSENKRRKGEKSGGKGLRHFSMKVCEKVQKKGITTYNEVADELVSELSDLQTGITDIMGQQFDQKNIRRRVYDALNVLMAMNIISKEKKEIRWIGLPTNTAQECQGLETERSKRKERIRQKTQQLQELILQQIAFKNLVERNRHSELENGPPDTSSVIRLPFIVVNTSKSTVIDCSISDDKSEYLFNFDRTFEIHDDIEVLKRMGLAYGLEKGQCSQADLQRAIRMIPKSLEPYVTEMASGALSSRPVIVKSELDIDENDIYLDQDVDSEVAMVTGNSPESSFDSYSDHQSSTHHDFSDDSESNI